MRRKRRVKIVATLGPASNNEETMRRLFEAGADVFRVNMSHATHDGMREIHGIVRKLEAEYSRPIGILVDLQGPKLRIGKFESGAIRLTEGDVLSFVRREAIGGLGRVHLPHPEIFAAVKPGHTLLLDDGKFRLRVVEASDVRIDAEVQTTGVLGSRKGISLPDTVVPLGSLTDKDRADLEYALSLGVAWIALSFVQRADDIAEARKLARGRSAIMAKIEKPSALNHLKAIIDLADGIMVARGDLGIEIPLEQVPLVQKEIIAKCNRASKPVVTATQMLESMTFNSKPTRAEVTDVANAILDGTDAVMLSGETARGSFPTETVRTMAAIAREVEREYPHNTLRDRRLAGISPTTSTSIAEAATRAADELSIQLIVTGTTTGNTAHHIAAFRPKARIVALTPTEDVARRLALIWGTDSLLIDRYNSIDVLLYMTEQRLMQANFAKPKDLIAFTTGMPIGAGGTNLLKIHEIT